MGKFDPKSVLKMAQEARKNGDLELAAKCYGELALFLCSKKKGVEAKGVLERALKLSKDPRILIAKVVLEDECGEVDKAKATMSEMVDKVAHLNRMDEFSAYVEKDLASYPKYRRQYFIKVLRLDRTSILPFAGLARAELDLKAPNEAIKIILKALKIDSHDGVLLQLLSSAIKLSDNPASLAYLKRFEESKITLEDLKLLLHPKVKKEPSFSKTEDSQSKELDTMIRNLEELLGEKLESDQDEIKSLVAEFKIKADIVLGNDSQGRLDLCLAYLEMGLFSESREVLKKIGSSDALYFKARSLLAETLMREGLFLESMDVLNAILRNSSLEKEVRLDALYKLLKTYVELGDYKKALEQADQIKELHADFRDVRILWQDISSRLRTGIKSA